MSRWIEKITEGVKMKKFLVLQIALFIAGCTVGSGKFTGKVVDVSWEGLLLPTCEVDVQYGDQSSKTARYSTEDKAMCSQIEALMGKPVNFKYDQTNFECFFCGSGDLIRSAEAL